MNFNEKREKNFEIILIISIVIHGIMSIKLQYL